MLILKKNRDHDLGPLQSGLVGNPTAVNMDCAACGNQKAHVARATGRGDACEPLSLDPSTNSFKRADGVNDARLVVVLTSFELSLRTHPTNASVIEARRPRRIAPEVVVATRCALRAMGSLEGVEPPPPGTERKRPPKISQRRAPENS